MSPFGLATGQADFKSQSRLRFVIGEPSSIAGVTRSDVCIGQKL